jgi:hypothetical protein
MNCRPTGSPRTFILSVIGEDDRLELTSALHFGHLSTHTQVPAINPAQEGEPRALVAEDEDRRAGIDEAAELGRPAGRGADDAAAMAAEPVSQADVCRNGAPIEARTMAGSNDDPAPDASCDFR